MLVHEMAVLHRGMMKAATRMNEELYAAAGLEESGREAANVRACRLAGAISSLSATPQAKTVDLRLSVRRIPADRLGSVAGPHSTYLTSSAEVASEFRYGGDGFIDGRNDVGIW